MAYRWKPSKSQSRAFAQRMQDPGEQQAYNERKQAAADKRRAGSKYDYSSAGGKYIATEAQHNFVLKNMDKFVTPEQTDAANQVLYSYSCQEKIHHDHIHAVNEVIRTISV